MNIIIERGKIVPLETLSPFSIAVDGYCLGPQLDNVNNRYSFDHHGPCSRFATTSSAMQCFMATSLGLDPENYTCYLNDVDIDVALSVWFLKNVSRCSEPLVVKLVNAVSLMDAHCGSFDVNGMTKIIEWISEPEILSKKNGDFNKLSNDGLISLLEAMLRRIDLYCDGNSQTDVSKLCVKHNFSIVRNENDYVIVTSDNAHALADVFHAGFDKIVLVRPQDDESNSVTITKKPFVANFPLDKICAALNKAEFGNKNHDVSWGGNFNSVIGSPRFNDGSKSKLSVEEIYQTIDSVLLGKTLPQEKKKKKPTKHENSV